MELIEGRSLAVLGEKGGPLRLEDAVAVAEQVGAALAAVHARNLIHRDIKPANIIVEGGVLPGGRAVLLDLGVARALDATAATTTGLLIGTPGFMAPEQVEPDAPVTPLVDVYQLAATLYTLLAGRPPFQGETTRVLYAIVHHPPPDLLALRPDLPPDVVAVITAALAKDPALRGAAPAGGGHWYGYGNGERIGMAACAGVREPAPNTTDPGAISAAALGCGACFAAPASALALAGNRDGRFCR
jgi:serine/threonine-protein kinase